MPGSRGGAELPSRPAISLTLLVLAVAVALGSFTIGVSLYLHWTISDVARATRSGVGTETANEISGRLLRYVDLATSGRGLLEGSDELTPDEFHWFVEALELPTNYPSLSSFEIFQVTDEGTVVVRHREVPAGPWAPVPATISLLDDDLRSVLSAPATDRRFHLVPIHAEDRLLLLLMPAVVRSEDDARHWIVMAVMAGNLVNNAVRESELVERLAIIDRNTGQLIGGSEVVDPEIERSLAGPFAAWDIAFTTRGDLTRGTMLPVYLVAAAGALLTVLASLLTGIQGRSRRRAWSLLDDLRRSERRARAIVEAAPVAIIELEDDRVVMANPTAIETLGADELRPAAPLDVAVVDRARGVSGRLVDLVKDGDDRSGATHVQKAEAFSLPERDGRKARDFVGRRVRLSPDRSLLVFEDVTERENTARQLIKAQRMEAIGLLAGGVAHDFNNFLMIIRGYTQLTLETEDLSNEARTSLTESLEATDRAADVVAQLLTLSRRSGSRDRRADVVKVVENAASMIRRAVGANIVVTIDLHGDTSTVRIDPGRLEQVLVNLVLNARDAMSEGGHLRIVTEGEGDTVVLRVSDTGAGMTDDVVEHLFDPYFTTKSTGNGLGLPMAEAIVEDAGGGIEVTTTMGVGTSFTVRLPLAEHLESTPPLAEQKGTAVSGDGRRVLLVDDEPGVLELSAQFLRRAGFDVTTARDAETAMQLVHDTAEPFEVLLSDVVLPGRSGVELAAELAERSPHLKILLMSGYAEDVLRRQGGLPRDVRLLHKPFDPQQMVIAVQELDDR